ncbi:MAG: type II toxin-antitoxin system VapC family toxin [Candidatus Hydrothermarchaeaceae archaeon]
MKVFDSFTWVEYFSGSKRGLKVKDIVEDSEIIYTPAICLTEIKAKYLREGKDPTDRLDFIEDRSLVLPIDRKIALKAGECKVFLKLHTADALIYATGMVRDCEVVTGDPHFNGLENVILI